MAAPTAGDVALDNNRRYSPAAGVKTDFVTLLSKFAETNSVRYTEFATLWCGMKMSLIFAGRQEDRECREVCCSTSLFSSEWRQLRYMWWTTSSTSVVQIWHFHRTLVIFFAVHRGMYEHSCQFLDATLHLPGSHWWSVSTVQPLC